jgi:hypothetical protein
MVRGVVGRVIMGGSAGEQAARSVATTTTKEKAALLCFMPSFFPGSHSAGVGHQTFYKTWLIA